MANIEIKTSQNVVIEFETASMLDRSIAFLIDIILVTLVYGILRALLFVILARQGMMGNIVGELTSLLFFFSIITQEILTGGRSVGKRVMGVKIIKLDGREPSPNDFFVRWSFKIIDVMMSLGTFALFVLSSSKRGQRLGDIVANTSVIKLKYSTRATLNDVLRMHHETSQKEVMYPEARRINDEYALAIKHVVDRHQNYNNITSNQLVVEMVDKLRNDLDLEVKQNSYIEFLKIFLSDYVKVTR